MLSVTEAPVYLTEILVLTGTVTDTNDPENQATCARPLLQSRSH